MVTLWTRSNSHAMSLVSWELIALWTRRCATSGGLPLLMRGGGRRGHDDDRTRGVCETSWRGGRHLVQVGLEGSNVMIFSNQDNTKGWR
ncbi:hypothetical protein B0H63DRAFT_485787 [Podospora didyma]|uniref:Uncharacterized protein n=1 Tax=Podospora didyma TaxID=330526 RepID=A0AAE0N594_9PEZI|nr:hypothetical protein B0H63DRAFT_485787 [Podospora didyma]